MSAKSLKKRYEALRKKYKLPSFDFVEAEFETSDIEEEEFLLREIRKKIAEKLESMCIELQRALYPDQVLADMYESRFFDDDEKKQLFELFKQLMSLHRSTIGLMVQSSEKADAEFVKTIAAKWQHYKAQFIKFAQKLKESWQ